MRLMPAIDLKNGKCVRLLQGRDDDETVYGNDPVAVAESWAEQGAKWLHIVNLDGAFGRASNNVAILEQIAKSGKVKIEFGGGLRTEEDVRHAFEIGVEKVVLGTLAFEDGGVLARILMDNGATRLIVALDAKDGMVTTRGWTVSTGTTVMDAAKRVERAGVREILYTDVARDGMLSGPDLAGLRALMSGTSLEVIASGGIGSLAELRSLGALDKAKLSGVIVGKAFYERKFTYSEAVEALQPMVTPNPADKRQRG